MFTPEILLAIAIIFICIGSIMAIRTNNKKHDAINERLDRLERVSIRTTLDLRQVMIGWKKLKE